MKRSELERWIAERQAELDKLLEENSPEYIHIRMKFQKEHDELVSKGIEDETV
jgi:hypothetical protein